MGPWRRELVGSQGRPCGGGKFWPTFFLGGGEGKGLQSSGKNQSELLHGLQECPVDQKSPWGTIFEVALTQGLFCSHTTLSDTSLSFSPLLLSLGPVEATGFCGGRSWRHRHLHLPSWESKAHTWLWGGEGQSWLPRTPQAEAGSGLS